MSINSSCNTYIKQLEMIKKKKSVLRNDLGVPIVAQQ